MKKILITLGVMVLTLSVAFSANPKHERNIPSTVKDSLLKMGNAASNPDSGRYTYTMTVGNAAKDSTLFYDNWVLTGTTTIATGDSCQVKVFLMAGYGDVSTWKFSKVDSLTITTSGSHSKEWTIPIGAPHFYLRIEGQTGNGNAPTYSNYLRRVR